MRVRLRRDRLREILARSNQSQNYWAMRLGLARGHWSELVNGKHVYPSGRTRERLLEVLGVPFEALFEIEAGPDAGAELDPAVDGRYLIDSEIGRGGMGTVYLARDLRLNRPVAVKMVSAEVVSGIGLEQFFREIGLTSRLHHPHVLPLHDAGHVSDQPYYVTPYLRDGSLRDILDGRHRLPLERALAIVYGIAQGLGHAHAHNVLHCDVKPENILLAGDHPYVGDFGVARVVYQEALTWGRHTGVDSSAGTPAYVSPEQASGDPDLDARTDVYSLAAMTFEMLAGRPPFVGTTPLETVTLRFREPPPDVRRYAPETPAAVSDVLARALSFNPDDRQPGVTAFAADLATAARPGVSRALGRGVASMSRSAGRLRRRLGLRAGHGIVGWVREWGSDVRSAVRAIRRAPGWAAVVACTLGLAIGANAIMFGIADRLLLRAPSHITRPERVFRVRVSRWFDRLTAPLPSMSYPAFEDLRDRAHAFSAVAAVEEQRLSFGRGVDARQVQAQLVTGQYFRLLGVQPALGRFFGEPEDRPPDGTAVVVLGYQFWRRAFDGDTAVLGRAVELDRRRYVVVGVAPPGFTGADLAPVDLWAPMSSAWATIGRDAATSRGWQFLETFVRVRDGVTEAVASEDARRAYHEGHASFLPYEARAVAGLSPLIGRWDARGETVEGRVTGWLLVMSGIVLLIACANVANLMVARALTRQPEMAIRQAIGGSRGRLLRHLITESGLLALAGAAVGVALAGSAAGVIRRALLPQVAWDANPVNGRVLLVSLIATVGAAVVASLLPFARGTRLDLAGTLHGAARGRVTRPRRLLTGLLLVQTGLATSLLIGAGLFVRSLRNVVTLDLGFDPRHLLYVAVAVEQTSLSPTEALTFQRVAIERLRALPGVTEAGGVVGAPFTANYAVGLDVPGLDSVPSLAGGGPYGFEVSAGALRALGVRVQRGRPFTDADDRRGAAPVVMISERTARTLWPDADPLTKCVRLSDVPGCTPVIGVVADVHRQGLREDPFMSVFLPLGAVDPDRPPQAIVVRTAGSPEAMVEPIRRTLLSLHPDLPFITVRPYESLISPQARSWRLGAAVFTAFGLLSLAVAAAGVFGVLSFTVAWRMPELGIRAALGATSRRVLLTVIGAGVATAAAGVVIGATLALAIGTRFQGLLFETSARDPAVFVGAAAVILGLAFVASLVPATRAARADPLSALRAE
jgi:predicted permease